MKLRQIAIATLAVCGGSAFAVAPDLPAGAAAKLYVGGSSAIAPVLAGIFTQNCPAANLTTYSSKAGAGAFLTDTANGASHNVYYCSAINNPNDFGTGYNGKSIAVWKRDAGGSGIGVFAIADGAAPIAMLDTSTCDDVVGGVALCPNQVSVQPDAGISDLEPTAFNPSANRPPAYAAHAPVTTANFESAQPVAMVVFGIAANTRLFNQMAADQGTATPSISSAAVYSLFSPGWIGSGLGWGPATTTNASNQLNICYRGIGSGTRASAQIQFLQLPNNKFTTLFEVAGSTNPAPGPGQTLKGGNHPNEYFISEESSSGNVIACVEAAEAGGGYAIGFASTDRDLSAKNAKFLYLDNQNPNRVAAQQGQYPWTFQAFYNTNKTVRNAGGGANAFDNSLFFAKAFRDAFKKPSNINAIPAGPKNGVMADTTACNADHTLWTVDEQAVCSRVTRNGDSRTPLIFGN